MGYSSNPKTLESIRPWLTLLEEGQGCKWETEPNRAHHFAYKIREALHIARTHPELYPKLAAVAQKFSIVVTSSREVQAIPAKSLIAAGLPTMPVVNHGMEEAGGPRTLMGAQTAASIIQTWTHAQPSNDRFFFPQASLGPMELQKLYTWATKLKLIFLVDHKGALTLQKRDTNPDLAAVAWTPEDLEPLE